MISAADRQVVGCPDPAAVVMRSEWILSLSAIVFSCSWLAIFPPIGIINHEFGPFIFPKTYRSLYAKTVFLPIPERP